MKILISALVVIVVLAGAALAYALGPSAIATVERPMPESFSGAEVKRGAELARLGYCNTCHTVRGGDPYAGGYAIETSFGTIYSTNITPDEETGIGRWSQEAFSRSLREGLDREGHHLYPAFPYTHFTKLTDQDARALYAFFMTRTPIRRSPRENDLPFPLNWRPVLAGWKLFFFDSGRFEPDGNASDTVNHGAYLVEGLSHCGACHTPRNFLQAEKRDDFLRGGEAEGWTAPAIAGDLPTPKGWTEAGLKSYLTGSFTADHGVAAGPMQPVAENLAAVPAADVEAIAAYVLPKMRSGAGKLAPAAATSEQGGNGNDEGRVLYAGLCASCHEASSPARRAHGMNLADSSALNEATSRNFVNFVLAGVQPPEGRAGSFMPALAGSLTDEQLTVLAAYLRHAKAGLRPWDDLGKTISNVRETMRRADAEPQR
ncbi:c-type cytochrome [Jiella avicenniae]|uniref:C-type cytochrome n=1 Tax=Jiella avicenniae TaxID=2907202 RepID=A0A9X1P2H9_9HYPH|nr:cytochrome c [Jiella avicenniae]MCE7030187.1 c-type cytochrome [Jiella avicenniae]